MTTPATDSNPRVEKFLSLDEQVDKMMTTMQVLHSEAFNAAARAALTDGNGLVDMKLLQHEGRQEIFINAMIKHYVQGTAAAYSQNAPKDVLMRSLWLEGYTGLSQGNLSRMVREQKSNYTLDQHMNMTIFAQESLTNEMGKRLRGNALSASGLTDADRASIVKYMKVDDLLDPDRLTVSEAGGLLRMYRRDGTISRRSVENLAAYKRPMA